MHCTVLVWCCTCTVVVLNRGRFTRDHNKLAICIRPTRPVNGRAQCQPTRASNAKTPCVSRDRPARVVTRGKTTVQYCTRNRHRELLPDDIGVIWTNKKAQLALASNQKCQAKKSACLDILLLLCGAGVFLQAKQHYHYKTA